MSLAKDFQEHTDAGFSGIWVVTDEIADAQEAIAANCNKLRQLCLSWSLADGLVPMDNWSREAAKGGTSAIPQVDKPDDLLKALPGLAVSLLSKQQAESGSGEKKLSHGEQKLILMLPNFHLKAFAESAKLTQQLARLPLQGRLQTGRFVIVILSHTTKIPPEYEKLFVTLKHELPNENELMEMASSMARVHNVQGVSKEAISAACGLTRVEAENAFSLSLVKDKPFDPQIIWNLKAQMIEKSGLLTIYRGTDTADNMAGVGPVFDYGADLIKAYDLGDPLLMPRGLMLYGVQGGGKSQWTKCFANRVRLPLLILDIGKLMGGLVGETESNTRRCLAIAEAMAPCILMVDEIEKALGGASSSGARQDSGVGLRMLGTLLTWLNDHTTKVFFVGTCNDMKNLPAALTRAERFDAKFFLDFPTASVRAEIWLIYYKMFKLELPSKDLLMDLVLRSRDWTGAEIRSCCRLAAIQKQPVMDVAKTIVPVSRMYADEISEIRSWASNNCLAADRAGIYTLPGAEEMSDSVANVLDANGKVPRTIVVPKKKGKPNKKFKLRSK